MWIFSIRLCSRPIPWAMRVEPLYGAIGFGTDSVRGIMRWPRPAAMMMAWRIGGTTAPREAGCR